MDGILAVTGLTGITGGPHDLAASLGYAGQPEHQERISITTDTEKRARSAGKHVAADDTVGIGITELMLGAAREVVDKHKNDKIG